MLSTYGTGPADGDRSVSCRTRPSATACSRVRSALSPTSPAQTAPAWILTRGDDIAPIPGTRRVGRVEENTAADSIELTTDQLDRLERLTPASGARHDEGNMQSIDR